MSAPDPVTSPLLQQPADLPEDEPDAGTDVAATGGGEYGGAVANWRVFAFASVHCLAAFCFGYDTVIVSPAMEPLKALWNLNDQPILVGLSVSGLIGSALVGALIAAPLANRFGRLPVLLAADVPLVLGALGCAGSVHVAMLIAMRVLLGVGIGLESMVVPLIITEMSPPSVRGAVGTLNQLFITVGILVSYVVGLAFNDVSFGWRFMFGLGAVPALAHAALSLTVCRIESPRWLVLKGRDDAARRALRRLYGAHRAHLVDKTVAEIKSTQAKADADATEPPSSNPLKIFGGMWWPLALGLFIQVVQQWSGINAILFYSTAFFKSAGFQSDRDALLASMGLGALNVVVTMASVYLIERAGRRVLLWGGLIPMIGAQLTVGTCYYLYTAGRLDEKINAYVSIAMVCLYVIGFAVGLGPIPWLIMSEMFPSRQRAAAMSAATGTNWLVNGLLALLFPVMVGKQNEYASYVFWGFTVICLLGLVFVVVFVPETKNKSVPLVQRELRRRAR
eukprot:CAMPEP_0198335302 /NCGR_PEP_ID=MMETSP1450-20131203/20230_1 /TAXON_ID=753684 ORGANISM="Madagascaria erythrocladiodes, Strain CCMP3234" /NCGR_SAMPLE_ID=MMETSP1450 /ASSEMBLY_ACC=CAM_ASM_001115 /LENGTH=506 /DNA_ID=CAMNT_0044039961 /DNA_START=45 /DNA_END=1562 /DNA_ORIENTATION=+